MDEAFEKKLPRWFRMMPFEGIIPFSFLFSGRVFSIRILRRFLSCQRTGTAPLEKPYFLVRFFLSQLEVVSEVPARFLREES